MNKLFILVIVSFSMLMEAVDTTIINTAIPSMAQSLKVNPLDLKLALISYLLSLAIFIPISGWIADKFGLKRVFILALALFTMSSIGCGFAHNLNQLVIARFIQGLGGSLTMPLGRLVIVRISERHEFISKMSIVVMVAALGIMLGPILGGILTTHYSWSWVFWVNAPIGLTAIIATYYVFPEMPPVDVPPLDKAGFVLFGTGLATLTYSLSAFSETIVSQSETFMVLCLSTVLLLLYYWHSQKQEHPIVNIVLLRKRTVQISVLGNLCARLSFGGVPFLLPLLLQMGLKYSPQLSGFLLAPMALGVLMVKPMSLKILRLLGYKNVLVINTALVAGSLCLFSFIDKTTSFHTIAVLTFLYGFLISIQYTGMNSLAYANVDEKDLSAATSIMSTIQQLAQSFGVAFAAILVGIFSPSFATNALTITKTLHQSFISMGIVTLLSIGIFLKLKPEDGQELIDIPPIKIEKL